MDGTTVSALTEALVNILIGSFALVGIGFFISEIQSAVYDRKREKREREKAEQDKEYHEARMQDLR